MESQPATLPPGDEGDERRRNFDTTMVLHDFL
jgi:hypothetical protein